jgi:hypothetical protein
MRNIVKEAMQAGAVGFSTTRSGQHNGEAGVPMPSRLADEKELMALSTALKDAGHGVLMMTKDSRATTHGVHRSHRARLRTSLHRGRHSCTANETPEATFRGPRGDQAGQRARRQIVWSREPCPLNFEFTMHEPYVFEGLAAVAPVMEAKEGDVRRILASKELRENVKKELAVRARRMFNGHWHQMFVAQTAKPENRHMEARSVQDLAAEVGKHPFDFALDLALEENLDTLFTATLLNSTRRGRAHDARPEQHDFAVRCWRAPDVPVRCGVRLASARLLGQGAQADAAAGSHPQDHVRGRENIRHPGPRFHQTRHVRGSPAFRSKDRRAPARATCIRSSRRRLAPYDAATGIHGVWVNGAQMADQRGIRADAPKRARCCANSLPNTQVARYNLHVTTIYTSPRRHEGHEVVERRTRKKKKNCSLVKVAQRWTTSSHPYR